MGTFEQTAADARSMTPRGVSGPEGWWIVAQAIVLGVSHAFIYQSHAFEWGGILRWLVLFLTIFSMTWVSLRARAAQRVHPAGHGRRVTAALAWCILVLVVAGWFWIVPAGGHPVGWGLTSLVAAVGVLPLGLVGLGLIRVSDRRRN